MCDMRIVRTNDGCVRLEFIMCVRVRPPVVPCHHAATYKMAIELVANGFSVYDAYGLGNMMKNGSEQKKKKFVGTLGPDCVRRVTQ